MPIFAQILQDSMNSAVLLTAANAVLAVLVLFWMLRSRAAHRRALASEEAFRQTIENLAEGFYRSSVEGIQLYANRSLVRLNGYSNLEEMLACVSDIDKEWYVQSGRRAEFRRLLERDGTVTDFVSEIYRHKTRERIWISENARIVRHSRTGAPLYYEGSVREITEAIARARLEERLEKLANNLPGGLFQAVRDVSGTFTLPYQSRGMEDLLGIEIEELRRSRENFFSRIEASDLAAYRSALDESSTTLKNWNHEFRYNHPTKGLVWLMVTGTPERLSDGSTLLHCHMTDITLRKQAEEQVNQLAHYDSLTELPNRRVFTDRLEQALGECRREGGHGAVLFLDLDNFKALNDTKGHEAGDELLRKVAKRLRDCVRAEDMVSRFGGDEFLVLLPRLPADLADATDSASGAAAKIIRQFAKGFALDFGRHHCSPSIGVIVFNAEAESASDIIKSADIAMFEAKKRGRNTFVLFDPGGLRDASERYLLQRELSDAIRRDELTFLYQPQVDAAGRITGAEALVRWLHREKGLLSPVEFVPMAEKSGLIMEINEWVLNEALDTLGRWKAEPGMENVSLSVNVSVQQFRAPHFVSQLRERMAAKGVDPRRLTLELTEHIMSRDPGTVAERMAELRAMGVRLSLDDFGTGYSSLSQLNRFPFDEVKIDGAFVSDLERRPANRTLIEAILGMAKGLNLHTVAEHVGSQWQVDFLKERGCTVFQGFHFHAPMPEEELTGLAAQAWMRKAS